MFYGHSCSYLECSPDPCVLAYPFPLATWHLSMSGPSFPCSFRVQFYTLPDDCAIIYSQLLFVKLNNNLFTVFLHECVYIYTQRVVHMWKWEQFMGVIITLPCGFQKYSRPAHLPSNYCSKIRVLGFIQHLICTWHIDRDLWFPGKHSVKLVGKSPKSHCKKIASFYLSVFLEICLTP